MRFRYTTKSALFLLSASVSAVPTGQGQTRKNKRQSGITSSLEDSIEDAVYLDKDVKSDFGSGSNNNGSSDRDRPSVSVTTSSGSVPTSASASVSPSPATVSASSGGSSTARNIGIAGGTIVGFVFLLLIGFFVYRWRVSKRNNQGSWGNEKYPPIGSAPYERQQDTPPPGTLLGDKGRNAAHPSDRWNETTTVMPKPPPLVLVLQGSKRSPEANQTFFFENSSDRSSNLTLTTVYEEMRSPSQDSSISQTAPYPYRNPVVRKLYRSFQPPPIPESPEPITSRFSWTNNSVRTSIDSSPRFRTVTSWVDHQAGRLSVRAKLAEMQLGEEPSTPREFGHHPGAPVRFLAQHQRLESADLDRRIMHAK